MAEKKTSLRLRNNINVRMQKYKHNRMMGMDQTNAARAAGYSESYCRVACRRLERSAKVSLQTYLERAGVTDKKLAEHAAEGLEATKLCGLNDEEHPDWMARHKYFITALELKGLIMEPTANNGQDEALHIRVLNIVNNYNFEANVELKEKNTIDAEVIPQDQGTRSGVTIA